MKTLSVLWTAFLINASWAAAAVPSEWLGKHHGMSRACERDRITVTSAALLYNECKHLIVETLVSNDAELTVRVRDEKKCGWQDSIISLKKPYGTAVDFYNYKSRDDLERNQYRAFCGFGPKE